MKQYLLSLRSSDFTKSSNEWVTDPINLYNNSSYKNYSYKRTANGLNLIGDRTFVGTEMASPTYGGEDATAVDDLAVYVTNYGEVVYEQSTPSLMRFIDMSSQIDLLAFKHKFVNIPGSAEPTFSITIYESDSENGPWLETYSSGEVSTLFIRDVKPYVKIGLNIDDDGIDATAIGLIFYLEIGIHDPVSPVITRSGKNILRRFPSWTKIYEDSIDSATPSLDVPESEGGKFLTALIQDSIGNFQGVVDLSQINSYINTADESQVCWLYASHLVSPGFTSVIGDGIRLATTSSMADLLRLRSTDYAYYYDALNRIVYTLRKFDSVVINSSSFDQEAINVFNSFDEMGARVGLPRLYEESNSNYKKRILDVASNPSTGTIEGFKRTLRRELDLWRAYGATPDSQYLGATPEILEIYDIERSTPYFDEYQRPQVAFRNLVTSINEKYPSNIGYVKWGEGIWDYGGLSMDGISRIPSVYDSGSSPLGEYYRPGVGDFNDAKFEIIPNKTEIDPDTLTAEFSGSITISGTEIDTQVQSYEPIFIDYSVYASYIRNDIDIPDYGALFTYEIEFNEYGDGATPASFYCNFSYEDYDILRVKNQYPESYSSDQEYITFNIFDQDLLSYSDFQFKNYLTNEVYVNELSTPNTSRISAREADYIRVKLGQNFDYDTQSFVTGNYSDFRIAFTDATPNFTTGFTAGDEIELAKASNTGLNSNLYIGSEHYDTVENLYTTDPLRYRVVINDQNTLDSSSATPKIINISKAKDVIAYPTDATPQNLYYNVDKILVGTTYSGNTVENTIGGIAYFHGDQNPYLVPSSPNILYTVLDDSMSITQSQDFFESATISYDSNDKLIKIESFDGANYPFEYDSHKPFTYSSASGFFEGFIDEYGNTYEASEDPVNTSYAGDKLISDYTFNLDTFSMSSDNTYVIEKVSFNSASPGIKIYAKDTNSFIGGLNSALNSGEDFVAQVYADMEESYGLSVHPGYIYFDEEDFYIYQNPVSETLNGRFYELELQNTIDVSRPIIVEVGGEEWRHVVFEDSATPGKGSFTNTELVEYISGNHLNLAYKDVRDVVVVDSYTDKVIASSVEEDNAIIDVFNEATPGVIGRYYNVTYTVNNAYHVDPDVLETDTYKSYIYFSSTPSIDSEYSITYESSLRSYPNYIDLEIDQYENPINEGFVYVSNKDYNFSHIEYNMSPKALRDNLQDFANLTIVSYDENGNLKPGQTFRVSGASITADPEYITTNSNGFGKAKIYYSGSVPSNDFEGSFNIDGVSSSDPNGGINSSSDGYSEVVDFDIVKENYFDLSLKAIPLRSSQVSNGQNDVIIYGQVYWDNRPIGFAVDIDWYVGDYVSELFDGTSSSNTMSTDSDGKFIIAEQISVKDYSNPGIRFARLELSDPSQVVTDLQNSGETISGNSVTISGDIVYWNESYNDIQYIDDIDSLPPRHLTDLKDETKKLFASNAFNYNHANPDYINTSIPSTNWDLERWVPLSRYQQYQLGIFGSTPNIVTTYDNIHPDYEDS